MAALPILCRFRRPAGRLHPQNGAADGNPIGPTLPRERFMCGSMRYGQRCSAVLSTLKWSRRPNHWLRCKGGIERGPHEDDTGRILMCQKSNTRARPNADATSAKLMGATILD